MDHAEMHALMDKGEAEGCVSLSASSELSQELELDEDELDGSTRRSTSAASTSPTTAAATARADSTYVNGDLAVATTDALQLFLNEARATRC